MRVQMRGTGSSHEIQYWWLELTGASEKEARSMQQTHLEFIRGDMDRPSDVGVQKEKAEDGVSSF